MHKSKLGTKSANNTFYEYSSYDETKCSMIEMEEDCLRYTPSLKTI